jgi:hypothetical protein
MMTNTKPELHTPSELNAQAISNLAADPLLITAPVETVVVDQRKGGLVRIADLFATVDPSATFTVRDANNAAVAYAQFENLTKGIRILPIGSTPSNFSLVVTQTTAAGATSTRTVGINLTSLSFDLRPLPYSQFYTVAIGDLNGDGRKDLAGYLQNPDGSFSASDLNSIGLGKLVANGRIHRDNRLVDLDNDGDLDLITNTYAPSQPGVNIGYVFSNDGTGKFTEVTSYTNLNIQGYGETIVTADFNNDGLNDFYLPTYFRNGDYGSRLFINQGNLQFSEQTAAWKVTNSSTGSISLKGFGSPWDSIMPEGAQALDFNKDGLIDLYVASHLFINKGNSFFDANQTLGLPVIFEEGAKFFDWNNDGYLDLVILPPNSGPQLYQYNANTLRFELKDVFPSNRIYNEAYGVSVGDLNGDSWEDIYIPGGTTLTPRIYLNQQGKNFVEYRSQSTEKLGRWAGSVIDDINGNGKNDLVIGAIGSILDNVDTLATYTVAITLTGSKGEKNQYGRIVELRPTNINDTRVLTRVVDGGSGYMAQKDYALTFTDAQSTTYKASCYLIDYPSGVPVLVSFTVQSGKQYTVKSANGNQPIEVKDTTTNTLVAYTRNGGQSGQDDIINLTTPQVVNLSTGVGNDSITLNNPLQNSWAGSKVSGGEGNDTIVFNGSNAYTPAQIKLFGDAGNDVIRASTATGQLTGAIRIEGGTGNDQIEVGHIEGSQSIDSGIDGGDGDDSILVIDTLGGVGIFGNSRFDIFGGAGNDRIELRGKQFNLLGAASPMVDGGNGLDTFVWNTNYDLNQNTNQTGVDATNPSFAQEIGVRNVEILDVAASGALAKNIALSLDDVRQITAGSDFDRINLTGLGLTGIGKTLAFKLGDVSNQLKLSGWNNIGNTSLGGITYTTYRQSDSLLLVTGGKVTNTNTNSLSWLGTINNDVYTNTTDSPGFLAQGLAGDDTITIVGSLVNSRAGSTIEGGDGNDTLTFNGINAYTTAQIKIFGGIGNDVIRASTATGQYTGAIRIEGGTGNDQIEVGHIEGSKSSNSGIDGGDGNDSILVLNTLHDVGIFGNNRFDIFGGAGNDRIELRGRQFNLLSAASPMVDGGSGLDTFVWNARYDLNQNTNQTGVDAANPAYAQEIGVRNVEILDVAASGATGKSIVLNIDAVHQITAGSDFNRANLAGLNLTGIGNTLLVQMGSTTNNLTIDGGWTNLGNTSFGGITYNAYQLSDSLLLVNGSVTPRL